jgi:hypothetical protein
MMSSIRLFFLLSLLSACSSAPVISQEHLQSLPITDTNDLIGKLVTLELKYIAWACECANWASVADCKKYSDSADILEAMSLYLEPADPSLELADSLGYHDEVIRVTGQFYRKIGFPKGYSSEQKPKKSRVFRYTAYQVVKSYDNRRIESGK